MELDAISQPELEQVERIGSADLIVAFLDPEAEENNAMEMTREALAELPKPLRTIVVCNNGTHDASASVEVGGEGQSPIVSLYSLPHPRMDETTQQRISSAYSRVFAVGGKLGVRACGVIASPHQPLTGRWIYRLVHPVVNLGFDLVTPCYTRRRTEGLLNKSVLSPLHRALYGQRLQNPMGPDLGFSGRLLQHSAGQNAVAKRGAKRGPLATIAALAADGSFQICETQLGVRTQRPTDWEKLSDLLAEVLGAVFLEMEEQAAHWQSIRGSKAIPGFGVPDATPSDTGTVDVPGLIESFQLGTQNLQDIWGLVLPPGTLLEVRRLSRLPADQFRMLDQVWARIVYDFALGHRLRTISRDHLLRSITPLYLGWIASYTRETEEAGPAADSCVERLSRAFEDNKSYLVSRWRWPDRFNP